MKLKGKYTDCKIFSDNVDQSAISQVYTFLNTKAFEDCKVRFMPDIHAGCGAVIGTTVEIKDKVIPNVVGVDIGCGMLSYKLSTTDIDLEALDAFIHNTIPSGFNINNKQRDIDINLETRIKQVCTDLNIDNSRALKSLGSLGGGNHFIEVGTDEEGFLWLTVHSGSRNFGLQIAKYHQKIAEDLCSNTLSKKELAEKVLEIKQNFKGRQIQEEITKLKTPKESKVTKGLEYLTGAEMNNYLDHMVVAQSYASKSRELMLDSIVTFLNCKVIQCVESVHNYIDFNDNIIRKGAISAHENELVVIPWNMRDGLIIGRGKGNPDWNYSAPHGAGRHMSRSQAKKEILMEEFTESMEAVYSTCVSESTLDESPMAYKAHEEIELYLEESVEILHRVKPIYNFKA